MHDTVDTRNHGKGPPHYRIVEGFCGAGGLSLGLQQAGFDVACAFDIDEAAIKTYRRNLEGEAFVADASDLTGNDLLSRIGIEKRQLDLFAGGPPCQGFSKQKRGAHMGDDRNVLVRHYIRLVREIEPRVFLFENVAIFGQKRGQPYLREMIHQLRGYSIYPHIYNSADYGLAQTRQRFVAIGVRIDQACIYHLPQPTVKRWRTVGEVLEGLPEPPLDYSDHADFPNHQRARVTALNITRFSFVPQGGGWRDIPWLLRLKCHKNADTSPGGWPDVYGRLDWHGQCPTITGGFDSFTRGRYGHPLHDRPLTPREAARIRGFPDDFVFLGTRADIRSQIGNAVPPPLSRSIGAEIMNCLHKADEVVPMAMQS